jgi:hypothetical protein
MREAGLRCPAFLRGDAAECGASETDVLRPNELQSWFIGQYLVKMPLTDAV